MAENESIPIPHSPFPVIGLVDGNNFYVSCERVFDRKLVGKPVAVLSNNDGCCVAMSNEFKALGIPRGTPYFQLKDREKTGELIFRSSNYELYGDMSRRIVSILREEALDVEQYSIDEAFIYPPVLPADRREQGIWNREQVRRENLLEYGRNLRKKILRWTGIPCGVGFAPTKTLAKIANHVGKKLPGGVYILPEDPTDILARLPVGEVWGVGHRLVHKLKADRIVTAKDLRDAPDDVVRRIGGVTLLRTATELRGVGCSQDRDYDADPDSVSCSRSFGRPVSTREELSESVASFASQAAVKLRKHGLLASGCNIYAQLAKPGMFESDEGWEANFVSETVMFPEPTDATNKMLKAISDGVEALWVPGARYRKSGVVFFGLEHVGATQQLDLFSESAPRESSKLYQAIDALNARYGRDKVFSASEGIVREWKMKRSLLSKRSTTNWSELISVR